MSRFAKVNLFEVEDSVAGRVEGLEGRFRRKHLDSRDLGVSLFRYAPNLRTPMAHSHKEQEEAYVVVAGSGRILLDDETQELRTSDVIRVAPEVVRAFEAGPDGLDIIAVGGPKPEEGDGVRATATWPDTEKSGRLLSRRQSSTRSSVGRSPGNRATAFSYRTSASPTSASANEWPARADADERCARFAIAGRRKLMTASDRPCRLFDLTCRQGSRRSWRTRSAEHMPRTANWLERPTVGHYGV